MTVIDRAIELPGAACATPEDATTAMSESAHVWTGPVGDAESEGDAEAEAESDGDAEGDADAEGEAAALGAEEAEAEAMMRSSSGRPVGSGLAPGVIVMVSSDGWGEATAAEADPPTPLPLISTPTISRLTMKPPITIARRFQ